jgi:uncharacterized membrane protein
MNPLLASVLLSLVSAVCYAGAAIVQERVAATTTPGRYALLRNARWWGSVALNGAGALLHVAALALGPLTVVQPLGVLTIVLVAPMAALLVKRPVRAAAWRGILLVSAGLAVMLLLTGSPGEWSLDPRAFYAVAGTAAATVALLLGVATAGRARAAARSVALATAAGVAFGTASVGVKALTDDWIRQAPAAGAPVAALVASFAAVGMLTSQASYRGGGLAAPLATATVVNPVVAAAVGIALLEEGFRYGTAGALTALAAAAVAVYGLVVLVVRGGTQPTASGAPAGPEPAESAESVSAAEPAVHVRVTVPFPGRRKPAGTPRAEEVRPVATAAGGGRA